MFPDISIFILTTTQNADNLTASPNDAKRLATQRQAAANTTQQRAELGGLAVAKQIRHMSRESARKVRDDHEYEGLSMSNNDKSGPAEKMYETSEVATMRGVAIASVRLWINNGELRAVNVSRNRASKKPHYLVPESALAEFDRSRSSIPTVKQAKKRTIPKPLKQFV